MSDKGESRPRVPPRWFVRLAWHVHRGIYRVTRGRLGLWRAKPDRWGTLRLTTTGLNRPAAQRDHRLSRGRSEPYRDGDEWLG